jgi:hypothetical protein
MTSRYHPHPAPECIADAFFAPDHPHCASTRKPATIAYSPRVFTQARRGLGDDPIVVGVGPDPEPEEPVRCVDRQGTIVRSDSDRMESAYGLEMQRRVTGISLEELELLVGEGPDVSRQRIIAPPEAGCSMVNQSLRERPA